MCVDSVTSEAISASATSPSMLPTVEMFGATIVNIDYDELCAYLDECIAAKRSAYVVTPNVDHICRLEYDVAFQEAYRDAALVLVDGTIVVWALRLLGIRIKEKLSGSDLVPRLSQFAADRSYSIFFLGAAEGVGAEAARRLQERNPGLRIAGVYSPPMGFEKNPEECEGIVRQLREANADLCFVAFGSPKQEIWMRACAQNSGMPVLLGIGASLDFAAGRVTRAPRLFQVLGLEWFWRLALEPRRLWRRYLVDDARFLPIFFRAYFGRNQSRDSRG